MLRCGRCWIDKSPSDRVPLGDGVEHWPVMGQAAGKVADLWLLPIGGYGHMQGHPAVSPEFIYVRIQRIHVGTSDILK